MPKGKYRTNVEKLHRERWERRNAAPNIDADPELAAAYRDMQLHWLRKYPEYRKLIQQRVHEAATKAERLSKKIDKSHEDVDYLGREVDGCG